MGWILGRYSFFFITSFLVSLVILLPGSAEAARAIDLPDPDFQARELAPESEIIRRVQVMLKKVDQYSGPIDGQINKALKKAIRAYQKNLGKKVDG